MEWKVLYQENEFFGSLVTDYYFVVNKKSG